MPGSSLPRVHCFHYLIPLTKQGNYAIVANVESMDYDPLVVKLNKDVSAIEEVMGAALQQHKFQYIFEGQHSNALALLPAVFFWILEKSCVLTPVRPAARPGPPHLLHSHQWGPVLQEDQRVGHQEDVQEHLRPAAEPHQHHHVARGGPGLRQVSGLVSSHFEV